MKNRVGRKLVLWLVLGGVLLLAVVCGLASRFGHLSIMLPVEHKPAFQIDPASVPTRLHVDGNKLVDPAGRFVILKGLMAPDPARLNEKGKFNQAFVDDMRQTGANVIRIPVHPDRWEQDADYLWRNLDPMVAWAGEAGMYAIIDLHFIGNVETGEGRQMADTRAPSKEFTLAFWRQVAAYFKNAPHVIFEIFNEPEGISANDWRRIAGEIVAAIRETGAKQLVIVGGTEYSHDLSWVLEGPVAGTNIAYAAHIYPSHSPASWDAWFGNAAGRFPVIVSEWGWIDAAADRDTSYLVGSQASYGEPLIRYLDAHSMGWVACWYDDEWLPAMFTKGYADLNDYGIFVKSQLSGAVPQENTPGTLPQSSRRP